MSRYLWAVTVTGIVALLVLCLAMPRARADEQVFLALQINEGETVIARPNLLGEVDFPLSMTLQEQGQPGRTRVKLDLVPRRDGEAYSVEFKLTLPNRLENATGRLSLLHGEEKKLALDHELRPVTLKLLLMRVNSPEFDAYMELAKQRVSERTS